MTTQSYIEEIMLQLMIDNQGEIDEYLSLSSIRQNEYIQSTMNKINQFYKDHQKDGKLDEALIGALLNQTERSKWINVLRKMKSDSLYMIPSRYYKLKITKKEQFYNQLYFDALNFAQQEIDFFTEFLVNQFKTGYYYPVYLSGSDVDISEDDISRLITDISFNDTNFITRLTNAISIKGFEKITKELDYAIIAGVAFSVTRKRIKEEFSRVIHNRLASIIQTESTYNLHKGTNKGYTDVGVSQWVWLSTLETNTCEVCKSLHGKVFTTKDPYPPQHPNCRCTSAPLIKGTTLFNTLPDTFGYDDWLYENDIM